MAAKGKGLMEQVRPCACHFCSMYNCPSYTAFVLSMYIQDLTTLDVTKLTPLSPEVISRQATINIGKQDTSFAARQAPALAAITV